jgi:hypothetical protein
MEDLPPGLLLDILVRTGAWKEERKEPSFGEIDDSGEWEEVPMPTNSALSVCRTWHGALMDSPAHLADWLVGAHGGSREAALVAACAMGREAAARHLLELSVDAPRANCMEGKALVAAAQYGRESIVRLLLDHPSDAPTADCCNCAALTLTHHEPIRRLLQDKLLAMLSPLDQDHVTHEIVRLVQRKRRMEQQAQQGHGQQTGGAHGYNPAQIAQLQQQQAQLRALHGAAYGGFGAGGNGGGGGGGTAAAQQAQQQQALMAQQAQQHQAQNLQLQQLLAMLSPQEQGLVMQMPAAQRPQAIVQLVQRKRQMQQQGK